MWGFSAIKYPYPADFSAWEYTFCIDHILFSGSLMCICIDTELTALSTKYRSSPVTFLLHFCSMQVLFWLSVSSFTEDPSVPPAAMKIFQSLTSTKALYEAATMFFPMWLPIPSSCFSYNSLLRLTSIKRCVDMSLSLDATVQLITVSFTVLLFPDAALFQQIVSSRCEIVAWKKLLGLLTTSMCFVGTGLHICFGYSYYREWISAHRHSAPPFLW